MKPKLYVDANLKVTPRYSDRFALVNVTGWSGSYEVEILILKPIASNARVAEAWRSAGMWNFHHYARYKDTLPRLKTCLFANEGEAVPIITDCHTGTSIDDFHGRIDDWYAVDDKGLTTLSRNKVRKNVYVSLLMTERLFREINPDVRFEEYRFSPND